MFFRSGTVDLSTSQIDDRSELLKLILANQETGVSKAEHTMGGCTRSCLSLFRIMRLSQPVLPNTIMERQ